MYRLACRCGAGLPVFRGPTLLLLLTILATAIAGDTHDDIVVEAHRGFEPSRTAGAVSVVEVDEKLPQSMDVAAAVETVSGATVRRLGGLGDYASVSLRGSSARQVQIFLDGIPLNPDGASVVNLSELPLFAFQRVEVWRGFAPASFAATPMGGVVNLVSSREPLPTTVQASYGSLDTFRLTGTSGFQGTLGTVPTDAMVVVEGLSTSGDFDYFDDNATLYNVTDDRIVTRGNNDKAQLTAHARWRLGTDALRLTLLDAFLAREEGLPGPMSNPAELARLASTRNLLAAQLDGGTADWCLSARLHWLARREVLEDPSGEVGVLSTGTRADTTHNLGLTLDGSWVATSWLLPGLTMMARHDRYRAEDLDQGLVSNEPVRNSIIAAASADVLLLADRLELVPVVQLTWLDNRLLGEAPFGLGDVAPDGEDQLWSVNPRLGVVGRPTPWLTLKANAGHYLRPPDFTELFGDRGAVVGNTDLLPETGWQWDVGLRMVSPANWPVTGSIDVTGFWSLSEDTIVMVQNSQRTMRPVNLGGALVQGIEASLTLDVLGWVDSQSNLTRTWSAQRSHDPTFDGNEVPGMPGWQLWQSTAVHWGDRVRVGHTFTLLSANYFDRTNWYRSTDRALHGLFVRAQPLPDWPSLELSVLNLTDETVQVVPRNPLDAADDAHVVQALQDFTAFPLPGRTFLLTLRWAA